MMQFRTLFTAIIASVVVILVPFIIWTGLNLNGIAVSLPVVIYISILVLCCISLFALLWVAGVYLSAQLGLEDPAKRKWRGIGADS
jgi:hypothetical protein